MDSFGSDEQLNAGCLGLHCSSRVFKGCLSNGQKEAKQALQIVQTGEGKQQNMRKPSKNKRSQAVCRSLYRNAKSGRQRLQKEDSKWRRVAKEKKGQPVQNKMIEKAQPIEKFQLSEKDQFVEEQGDKSQPVEKTIEKLLASSVASKRNRPSMNNLKGSKNNRHGQDIIRLKKPNGESSDMDYFQQSQSKNSESQEEDQYPSDSHQIANKPSLSKSCSGERQGALKKGQQKDGVEEVQTFKAEAETWEEFEHQIVHYVSNTFVTGSNKLFSLKLHLGDETVIASEPFMKFYFPRKLNQFYGRVMKETILSKAAGFAPF